MGCSANNTDEVMVEEESPKSGRFIRYGEILSISSCKTVFKGFDREDGAEVAWTKIRLDEDSLHIHRDRLLKESTLLRTLKNQHITKCYCSWTDEDTRTFNIITELCSSGSLKEYRYKHKCVDIKAIRKWGRQILEGLKYLHSLSPPVVHRNLKCDNVFVNGSNAEVKIGDFGFATVLLQGKAMSVTGTPEFMAPEVFEDEYDESVDIYAFGMCMLELVTCESPYSECKNVGEVYSKVIFGVRPAVLSKVKDPQARSFIEKCLVPASERLSAVELLKDPFFSCGNSKDCTRLQSPKCVSTINVLRPKCQAPLEEGKRVRNVSKASAAKALEFYISNGKKEWRLKGDKTEDNSVSLILTIINTGLRKLHKFEFIFSLDCDDSNSVAHELLLCDNEFSKEDLAPTIELMNTLLLQVGGGWRPQKFVVKSSHDRAGNSVENNHVEESTCNVQTEAAIKEAPASEIITLEDYGSETCGCLGGTVGSEAHFSFVHS